MGYDRRACPPAFAGDDEICYGPCNPESCCIRRFDSQVTLAFSGRTGVRSMNETIPLERVSERYDRLISGKAGFRVVLAMQ